MACEHIREHFGPSSSNVSHPQLSKTKLQTLLQSKHHINWGVFPEMDGYFVGGGCLVKINTAERYCILLVVCSYKSIRLWSKKVFGSNIVLNKNRRWIDQWRCISYSSIQFWFLKMLLNDACCRIYRKLFEKKFKKKTIKILISPPRKYLINWVNGGVNHSLIYDSALIYEWMLTFICEIINHADDTLFYCIGRMLYTPWTLTDYRPNWSLGLWTKWRLKINEG